MNAEHSERATYTASASLHPDPSDAAQPAAVLIVSAVPEHQATLRALVDRTTDVRCTGFAQTDDQVAAAIYRGEAQIVLVDGPSLGRELRQILDTLLAGRASVVLFSNESRRPGDRSVVAAAILDDSNHVRLDAVGVRLGLLASRLSRSARTLSSTSLRAMVDGLRSSATTSKVPQAIRLLIARPLELIVIFGGAGAQPEAAALLAGLSHVSVPVVLAIDDDAATALTPERVRAMTSVPVHALEDSTVLRRLPPGIVVPRAARGLFFESGSACVSRLEFPSIEAPLTSTGSLGETAVVVLLGGADEGLSSSVGAAANGGAVTLALASSAGPQSPAVEACLRHGVAEQISTGDLTWLLAHAVPLRG